MRLFFAFKVMAPWPSEYPEGRIIGENDRHLTLAFLGDVDEEKIKNILHSFPQASFKVAPAGIFDRCLLLPEKHPHVVAWHSKGMEKLAAFQPEVANWLDSAGFVLDKRPFLPHVTVARSPFKEKEWKKVFTLLPMKVESLHLYESLGALTYHPIWTYPLLPPFEEIEHTADVAFHIQAETLKELHAHAKIALAFKHPPLLQYLEGPLEEDLNRIIMGLNEMITRSDSEGGCPLKAVSFHGDIEEEQGVYKWEMIVDV